MAEPAAGEADPIAAAAAEGAPAAEPPPRAVSLLLRASLDLDALRRSSPRRASRGQWSNRLDYLMVLLGYAIGIGNLWRFPYLVGKYGGGSFVVAYIVCLCLVSGPLFCLELVWGQASRMNTIDCFRAISQRWVGVAYMAATLVFIVLTYYNLLLAYCCVYIANSFRSPLPWTDAAIPDPPFNRTAAEHYWLDSVLNRMEVGDIASDGLGAPHPPLVWGLLVTYVMIAFCLLKGHQSLAWAAYPLVILPLIMVIVIFGRAVSLDGAGKGVEFYLGKFDTDRLYSGEMWAVACGQIIFSLSPAMGTAVTMSSYTDPGEDVIRVGLTVAASNSAFSIFGGFGTFSILGHMSHRSCLPDSATPCRSVDELASSGGTGLAFISLAEGIGTFGHGWSQVFSVLLFSTLFVLGLDSTFAWAETMNTYINDSLVARGYAPRKWATSCCSSALLFLLGLLYCTRAGNYLLDIVDHFMGALVLLIIAFLELVMYRLDYGAARVAADVARACGRRLQRGWRWAWGGTAPALVAGLFVYLFVKDAVEPYEGYPPGLLAVGWGCLAVTCLIGPGTVAWERRRRGRRGGYSALISGPAPAYPAEPSPRAGPPLPEADIMSDV